ncbi:uncharacterized protein LOC112569218 [Pomacea canaliculata]|nr:uncharacterized protein LOC112569218 [Pomacea canaliculata]XP_025102729.1 uncharacterized protein LOC112569218 [Pomacea canaliculata]
MAYQVEDFKRNLPIVVLIASLILTCKAQLHEESPSEYEVHLTCAFGENIKENIRPFKITDDQSVSALTCSWRGTKPFCAVGDGYIYNWVLSDKVIVKKSKAPGPRFCNCFLIDQDKTEYERPCTVAGPFESLENKELHTQPPKLDGDIAPQKSPLEDLAPIGVQSDNTLLITGVALTAALLVLLATVTVIVIMRRPCDRQRQEEDPNVNQSLVKDATK